MQAITTPFLNMHSSMMMHGLLSKYEKSHPAPPIEIDKERFWEAIEKHFGVRREKLLVDSRNANLVKARYMCWQLLRECKWRLFQIATMFKKNHTTIMYGLNQFQFFRAHSPALQTEYEDFKAAMKSILYA